MKLIFFYRVEDYVPISIPLEAATNAAQVEEWKAKVAEAEAQGKKLGIINWSWVRLRLEPFFTFSPFFQTKRTW